ncbi:MAG: helix-hairpin-helix domain-containing protein, partial [Bacteroidota bacterium]|nr:helix-hairpin-helix domain-containing protein [Bacteroidota bacterium]
MWNSFLKDYFNFSRKERTGIIIIVALILFLIVLPFFYPLFTAHKQINPAEFENEIALLKTENSDSVKDRNYSKNFDSESYDDYSAKSRNKYEVIKAEVFYFDPNNTTAADWKRLGIRDKTIHTIQNYILKGGKFYKPDDIGKIWGLAPSDVQRLTPYVSIKKQDREFVTFEKKEFSKPIYPSRNIQSIDVNLADTTAYISLPGIGSKLSQRIITFREKLGGF